MSMSTRAVCQHVQKLQNSKLLISKETKPTTSLKCTSAPAWHSICTVSSKLITVGDASPSERFKKRQLERGLSCEMTTRHTSLAGAIVVTPQLDGVVPSCRPPHLQGHPSDGLVIGHRTKKRNTAPQREESTFTPAAAPLGQHTASKVKPVMVCWCASLLPVLVPVLGGFVWRVLTSVTRLDSAHVAERQLEAVPDEPEEQMFSKCSLIDCRDDPQQQFSNVS